MKYYDAYSEARHCVPKQDYKEDYAAIIESTFDNAFNVVYNEIEFEYEYGSNDFTPVNKVRVDSVINYTSSMVVDAEDFKTFIFLPDFPEVHLGMKFKWNNNYWLVISTNKRESLSNSAEVRRCNNVLRYFDEYGNKIYEPCIIDATLRFTKNVENYPITIGSNEEKVWCQRNSRTALIKPNDKFLFGMPEQRTCFRVYGAGTKNMLNTQTMNDYSPSLTEIYIHHYQYNSELDDLKEGFANAYAYKFSIKMGDIPTSYKVGDTGVFNASIYKSGELFDSDIIWNSSDESIIEVNDNGEYNVLQEGNCVITACMKENNKISSSVDLKVDDNPAEDSYEIVISPNLEYILQGNSQDFECYLYRNGTKQDNQFEFLDVSEGVPRKNYNITILSSNSFSIKNNLKYMKSPVLVKCKTENNEETISILLRGLY